MNHQKSYTVEEATRKMEHFCAYQERCHREVEEKLTQMRMIPLAKEHIITHLITHNFLNEGRFSKTFVRGKFTHKKWGKVRLERELKLRDISPYHIREALDQIPQQEYLRVFHSVAEKKAQCIDSENRQKARKQLADYLLYRGWESSLVYDKVMECFP